MSKFSVYALETTASGDYDLLIYDSSEALAADQVKRIGVDTLLAGEGEIFVAPNDMSPTVSNGCAAVASAETTSGRPDIVHLAFDGAANEFAQFGLRMPADWDLSTVTFIVHWTGLVAGAGAVVWQLEAVALGDGDTNDVAYGTGVTVTDTFQTAEFEHITSESGNLTVGGTPQAGDWVTFRIGRLATDAADTRSSADANLKGVTVFFGASG